MRFYLGVHKRRWLERTDVPLFVSRSSLRESVGKFPRARGPWALDSGGFTEVTNFGHWRTMPDDYAREVRLWQREIGNMDWAAPQDSMCEPIVLLRSLVFEGVIEGEGERFNEKGDNVTIQHLKRKYGEDAERFEHQSWLRQRVCVHQQRTIDNLLSLRELAPDVPWIPVLQGWMPQDYLAHAEAYRRAGVDLRREPTVGLGSVCRRKRLDDARAVIQALTGPRWKLRLHGFGLKTDAFKDPVIARGLASADSLAWSYGASMRRRQGKKCKTGTHPETQGCGNCLNYAIEWRDRTLATWEKTVLGEEKAKRRRAANPGEDDKVENWIY